MDTLCLYIYFLICILTMLTFYLYNRTVKNYTKVPIKLAFWLSIIPVVNIGSLILGIIDILDTVIDNSKLFKDLDKWFRG